MVVYVDTEDISEKDHLKPPTLGVLEAKSIGRTVPRIVVMSADQKAYLASMSYKQTKSKKAFRETNKQIKEGLAGKKIAKPADAHDVWEIAGKNRHWKAEFIELKDNKKLVLKKVGGKPFSVDLGIFTPAAQTYARELADDGAKPDAKKEKQHKLESWTNPKGKEIRARFISLNDGKVTLERANGKMLTIKLSSLSAESRKRAKELAGQP